MAEKTQDVARDLLNIIPRVTRMINAELKQKSLRQKTPILSPAHYSILDMLSEYSYTQHELAEKQAVTPPSMSHSIEGLVERGWIRRTRVPHDRRVVVLELTDAGQQALEEANACVAEIIDPLSTAECDQVLAGLSVLRNLFSQANEIE